MKQKKVGILHMSFAVAGGLALTSGAPAHEVGDCGPSMGDDFFICMAGSWAPSVGGAGTGLNMNARVFLTPIR